MTPLSVNYVIMFNSSIFNLVVFLYICFGNLALFAVMTTKLFWIWKKETAKAFLHSMFLLLFSKCVIIMKDFNLSLSLSLSLSVCLSLSLSISLSLSLSLSVCLSVHTSVCLGCITDISVIPLRSATGPVIQTLSYAPVLFCFGQCVSQPALPNAPMSL